MRIGKIIVFSLVFGIVLTIVSLVHYEHEAVPDPEMLRYGFPLPWLFHQTASIADPVEIWSVEWPILVVNSFSGGSFPSQLSLQ